MTASVIYKGALRCACTHVQSGTIIETDAPTDNRGKGERFSPTDSVCIALATCMITTMAIRGTDKNIELKGSLLEVTKHMMADPRRIGKIDIVLQLRTQEPINSEDKEFLQSVGDNCPVMKSLHPDLQVNVLYTWL